MLIHGELVVDVVLHETGERPPLGEITPEEAQVVHLPAGGRDPSPAPADGEKQVAHVGGAPEALVHQVERVLDGALDIDAQLEAQPVAVPEHLHEPGRVLAEGPPVGMREMDLLVDHDEAVGQRLLAEPPLHGATMGQRLPAARDEPAGHTVDHPRVEVVVAHELLHRERDLVRRVAEVLGDLGLDVPREHVVAMAREEVKLVPHPPQEGEGLVRRLLLTVGDESLVPELPERPRAELGRGEPHRLVDVAESARRLLHVGLPDVRRAAELAVALVPLGQRRLQELGEVLLVDVLGQHLAEAVEEPAVAHEEARLLHGGAAREVGARHGEAVRQAPHRVAHLQSQVPERVEEPLGHPLHVRAHLAVVDHHEVEVGERVQLAAPVAPEGDQHQRRGGGSLALGVLGGKPEQRREEAVHECRVGLNGLLTRGAAEMGGAEEIDVGRQVLAEQLEPQSPATISSLGRSAVESALGLGLDAPELAKEFRRHGETLARSVDIVKLGANLWRDTADGYNGRLCGCSGDRSWTRWRRTMRVSRSRRSSARGP